MAMLLVACCVVPRMAAALQKPNILIMGAGGEATRAADVVPCDSRVFKRVRDALSDQLHARDFDVFDEAAITVENFRRGGCRRSDAELIDLARSIRRAPIDVVVMLTIYANAQEMSYSAKAHTRIASRLVHAHNGQNFGSFEIKSPPDWRISIDCARIRHCLLEKVGDEANVLAKDLGVVLAMKLADATVAAGTGTAGANGGAGRGVPNAYTLIFDNFCDARYRVSKAP